MNFHGKNRVVLLVDMDCFYVQVVQRKNPELFGKPCAVVQYNAWKGGGIIAVGYEARKFGVTRQMRGDEAKEKCPDIHLVSVPENRGKADLTQFREAGAEVIEILAGFADCLERASIDEAYMDLTDLINRDLCKYDIEEVALHTFQNTNIVGIDNFATGLTTAEDIIKCDLYKQWYNVLQASEENLKLAIGAIIADKMRNEVKEKLGFTCSAGIGQNKMLAKIVAGFRKPNQQTLILTDNVAEMFQSTKMRKIRSLGGKLGKQLAEKFNIEYMSDLVKISLNDLEQAIGKKSADLVFGLCRGIDHEPVRPRQLPKSVGCSKNFNGKMTLTTKAEVYKWLRCLSEEVYERLEKEKEVNQRSASLITVGCTNVLKISQSRRCSQVKNTISEITEESFRALSEFNRASNATDWYPPLINLHLTASKFESFGSTSKAIDAYMTQNSRELFDELSKNAGPSVKQKMSIKSSITNFFCVAERSEINKPGSDQNLHLSKKKAASKVALSKQLTTANQPIDQFFVIKNPNDKSIKLSESPVDHFNMTFGKHGFESEANNSLDNIQISNTRTIPEPNNTPIDLTDSTKGFNTVNHELRKDTDNKGAKSLFQEQRSLLHQDIPENHISSITRSLSIFSKFCQSVSNDQSKHKPKSGIKTANHIQLICPAKETISSSLNNSEFNEDELKTSFSHSSHVNKSLKRANAESETVEKTIRNSNVCIDDIMVCEKCEKQIIAWNLPDHMDFHYAKELQDSLRNEFLNMYNSDEPPKKRIKQESSSNFFSHKKQC